MISELLKQKLEIIINEKISTINQINSGYSRKVFVLNDRYILKVVIDPKKDNSTIKEINFLLNNDLSFTSNIIFSDNTKNQFPFVYYLEEKIDGESLLLKWPLLKKCEKEVILKQLLKYLEELHTYKYIRKFKNSALSSLIDTYDKYMNEIIESDILTDKKIAYLQELKNVIYTLFKDAKVGLIHGDLHFNNVLLNNRNEIVLIDFENIEKSFIEKEFDPISRMSRNPNSFNSNSKIQLNSSNFNDIMNFIKTNIVEINIDKFDDRLLLFDCLNSLKWLKKYPKHKLYNELLFESSMKLLKKYDIMR